MLNSIIRFISKLSLAASVAGMLGMCVSVLIADQFTAVYFLLCMVTIAIGGMAACVFSLAALGEW